MHNQLPAIDDADLDLSTASMIAAEAAFADIVRRNQPGYRAATLCVFTEETGIRMKLFRTLSLDPDLIKIGREAHSLKSSAGTFGYRDLASLAEKLEEGARWLTDDGYRELLDRMDAAYDSAKAEELQR
jgi:Hpt domain